MLVVLLLVVCLLTTEAYTIRRFNDTYFMLSHGVAKEIKDVDTITSFAIDVNTVDNVTIEVLDEFVKGPSIPLIKKMDTSPDECMRIELLKIHALQKVAMEDFNIICKLMCFYSFLIIVVA